MIRFFLDHVRGWSALALVAFAIGYGYLVTNVLPQWRALGAAQGGVDIQAKAGASGEDVRAAIQTIAEAGLRDTALTFYALDFPLFTLLGMAGATLVAFGLRRLGWAATPARWLVAIPLLAALADAVETVSLALCFLVGAAPWADIAAPAITAKRTILPAAALLGMLLAAAGLLWWLLRLVWRPAARG